MKRGKEGNDIISICHGIMMSPSIYPLHLKFEAIQQISPQPNTSAALMEATAQVSDLLTYHSLIKTGGKICFFLF